MRALSLALVVSLAGCGAAAGTDPGGTPAGGIRHFMPEWSDPGMPPPSPDDPCKGAALGDGSYCGGALGADANAVYHCIGGATAMKTDCPFGCAPQPNGTPDRCANDPTQQPKGKGVWIWTFATHAGNPSDIATQAQAMGIGFVLIKSGEDTSSYATNFNAQVVSEFTSRGIDVYGWPYVRPGSIDAKVAAIADQARVPGIKGIILDVETEFVGHDADATALCRGIRAAVPGVFLGYTSFGWVSYHTDFPYHAFDDDCGDAFLPQTYWDEWTTGPIGGLSKGVDGAKALGLKAPVWPAQDNYNTAATADLQAFFDAAGPSASLWRWPDPSRADLLTQMGQLNWAN